MDNKPIALDAIRRYVRSGFYDSDEIVEIVTESVFENGEIDHGWLRTEIEKAFRDKRAEEKTWPSLTDCDRLDQVFESLEKQNVLSLQNAGYTQSEGLSDVAQLYREAGGELSNIVGYCFYHGQDLERVIESGELWLAFGHISGDDAKGVEIGERVKRAFEGAGFAVEWDETIETRLLVKDIKWRRRGRS